MKERTTEPLRGDAAYRAERQAIAKRNEAASAAAVRRRAEKEGKSVKEAAKRDQREMKSLPKQPGR